VQRLLGDNCHLTRDVRELVGRRPYREASIEEFYMEKTPRTHGYVYLGTATK
jgi:hypothetical protein